MSQEGVLINSPSATHSDREDRNDIMTSTELLRERQGNPMLVTLTEQCN